MKQIKTFKLLNIVTFNILCYTFSLLSLLLGTWRGRDSIVPAFYPAAGKARNQA